MALALHFSDNAHLKIHQNESALDDGFSLKVGETTLSIGDRSSATGVFALTKAK
jgi:hypothetical protein